MHCRPLLPVVLLSVAFTTGCQTPGQTGLAVGAGAGAAAAGIAKLAGANDTVTAIVGVGTALVAGGVSYEIHRQHEATEAQQRAAEADLRRRVASMPPEQVANTPKTWAIPVPQDSGQPANQPEYIRVDREKQAANSKVDVLDKRPPPGTTAQVEKESAVYFPE